MSKDDVIEEQARTINFLSARVEKLEHANKILRQALGRDLEVQTVIFKDVADKFDALERPILATILNLSKQKKRPVSYAEIIKGFNAKHPFIKVKPATIRRRVRKLRQGGHLMKHGRDSFYPNFTANVPFNSDEA